LQPRRFYWGRVTSGRLTIDKTFPEYYLNEKIFTFSLNPLKRISAKISRKLEAISKIEFWFKAKAGSSFNPQEY
jgi:hypothetical protein